MLEKFILATDSASPLESRIQQIEANQERLFLICTALTELLRDRELATEAEIVAKLQEVDLRDGLADGKFGGLQIIACPHCGNRTKRRHVHCIYCGKPLDAPKEAPAQE
jgi:hypothetical protein